MNQIVKILIAVISAVCALILIYFLISKSNSYELNHPKDVEPKINNTEANTLNSGNANNANRSSNESAGSIKRQTNNLVDFKMHKNYKLFNNERCGIHTGVHKVLNGKVTKLMDNPWMVALVYFNEKTNTTSVDCAGTLISENLVLTAAHCLDKKAPIAVILGDWNLAKDPDCVFNSDNELECADKVQEITDFELLSHKNYFRKIFEDIALIKLNEPAKLHQNNIKTICLPFDNVQINAALPLSITGWGRIDNNNSFSDVLLGTQLDYMPNEYCSKILQTTLTKGHICAGNDDGSDSCRGKS
ncbi:hypothetical protein ACKWTF_010161 [Chironomus riparius]